tara:strand:- start:92 stop:688 length:597 start_codon:yes stop_codon:yes gene_type:complete
MKTLLTLFVLFFSSTVVADDIFDFTIEKYEINRSLKDYFTDSEIENVFKNTYPGSNRFYEYNFIIEDSKYFQISFSIKKNDPQYLIYAISGIKLFEEDLDGCLKEKKDQLTKIDKLIKTDNIESYTYQYRGLGDGNSYSYITDYVLPSGRIRLYCDEWSRVTKSDHELDDSFSIDISTNEYLDFINNEAYQDKKDLSL